MKRVILFCLLLTLLVGCADANTQVFRTSTKPATEVQGSEGELGIVFIDSDAHYLNSQEKHVKRELAEWLGRDDIEIVEIVTVYNQEFLVCVELYYRKK